MPDPKLFPKLSARPRAKSPGHFESLQQRFEKFLIKVGSGPPPPSCMAAVTERFHPRPHPVPRFFSRSQRCISANNAPLCCVLEGIRGNCQWPLMQSMFPLKVHSLTGTVCSCNIGQFVVIGFSNASFNYDAIKDLRN